MKLIYIPYYAYKYREYFNSFHYVVLATSILKSFVKYYTHIEEPSKDDKWVIINTKENNIIDKEGIFINEIPFNEKNTHNP